MIRGWLAVFLVAAVAYGCAGAPGPAPLDTRQSRCTQCQRPIANPRLAAQLAVPGGDPLFFDDIQCLAEYLQSHTALPRNAAAFVADHHTGEWLPAAQAVYSRNLALPTPAASHLMAHGSPASRAQDPASQGAIEVPASQLFPLGAPDGTR